MRLFSFDDSSHREATQLLPWLVNGALCDGERVRVEEHVRACVACRRELDAQRELSEMVRGESVPPAMAQALARLHARIDAPSPSAALGRVSRRWWRLPSLLASAAAVPLVVVLVLVLLKPSSPDAPFRTLSARPHGALSSDAAVVIFDPGATQQRVQALLQELGARIVDGPNARGAYTVELPAGSQAAALQRLGGAPDVRFAQPAPGSVGMRP